MAAPIVPNRGQQTLMFTHLYGRGLDVHFEAVSRPESKVDAVLSK